MNTTNPYEPPHHLPETPPIIAIRQHRFVIEAGLHAAGFWCCLIPFIILETTNTLSEALTDPDVYVAFGGAAAGHSLVNLLLRRWTTTSRTLHVLSGCVVFFTAVWLFRGDRLSASWYRPPGYAIGFGVIAGLSLAILSSVHFLDPRRTSTSPHDLQNGRE